MIFSLHREKCSEETESLFLGEAKKIKGWRLKVLDHMTQIGQLDRNPQVDVCLVLILSSSRQPSSSKGSFLSIYPLVLTQQTMLLLLGLLFGGALLIAVCEL